LIDYVIRDRRWCRGNLQHLRLLGVAGLHPVSRFHLFQGAAAYLMSPAWFLLLVFWTLLGRDAETNVVAYFSEANPLFPNWPPAMTHLDSAVFLLVMYAVLLAPKITGAAIIALNRKAVRLYGGRLTFLQAFLSELLLSVAYAPIMMIQQTRSVLQGLLFRSGGWSPQQRKGRAYPLRTLLAFHWLESLLGLLLTAGVISGLVSLWLLPIALSLLLAVPLSALSALRVTTRMPRALRLDSPFSLREPAICIRARKERAQVAKTLDAAAIAAE
jgi:membrane glycosyltransferase